MKLPKEDVEGIKLAAMGGSSKRDYLGNNEKIAQMRPCIFPNLNQSQMIDPNLFSLLYGSRAIDQSKSL